jgi:hypothetical protein
MFQGRVTYVDNGITEPLNASLDDPDDGTRTSKL